MANPTHSVARSVRPLQHLKGALLCAFAVLALTMLLVLPGVAQTPEDTEFTLARPTDVLGIPSQGIDRSLPASRRHALVIGNGSYQNVTALPNAVADARLVADVLRQSGYLVQYYEDLTKRGFENALRSMLLDVSRGSEIVIYYAGHGVQVGGSNRLIPVDAAISSVYDIPFETVSLSSILSIAGSRARSLVVIMDSCRDNPFPAQEGIVGLDPVPETLRTGFTAQDTPINSLLVFSTSPGAKALDGDGANSPFTLALHDVAMANPKAPLPDMLRKVRARVYNQTGGLQLPWESSSLIEEVSLDLEPGLAVVASDSSLVPPDAGKVVEITLPLEPKVALGEALRTAMGASSISLSQVPHGGRLEVSDGTRFRGLSLLPISSDQISSMVYSGNRLENLAKSMEEPRFTDTFQVTADGLLQTVELTLEVDPCDLEAGNYLDPDGVGVARYANEIEPEVALPACQAAIARSPQTGRFHYQLGRVLLAMGDLDGAEEAFNKSLALNHTRAWQALGLLEIQRLQAKGGATRPRAPETAMAKLAIGVEVGDPYAFHTLGQLLLEQETDPALKLRGFELMLRAMEVGHTFSMNALGAYFLKKDSPQYDPTRGVRYYKESAARNDIYGYDNMGFAAQEGIGDVAKDPKAALEWFTRAADAGHPTSPSNIGRMYQGNAFGAPDLPEAIRWFDIGLLRGDGWGGANAAWIIAGKQPRGFDIADAATRAAKASVLNNQGARQSADELLAKMPAKALDAGAQKLMSELGEETVADGAFGPGSKEALTRIAVQFDTAIPDDRLDRLKTLARIYWTTRHLRVDLF